ncbi:phosphodiester glycosidase family protein [Afifella pfennigii]|uniref:phosphodiester glycosidase family protein n=1 Tax=Afifella pfennigii TaxID=209897 RepID=UPI00047DE988|nr:phosphodiester glycosidase family protein [Afifella pfennigii]
MRFSAPLLTLLAFLTAGPAFAACESLRHDGTRYSLCRFDPAKVELRTYLNDASGKPYGSFRALKGALAARGEELVFAMNGGMYDDKLAPVGLYMEEGRTLKPANTAKGPGNFHMLPNGVFWVGAGRAGVMETKEFLRQKPPAEFATQSGPMLLVDGARHPRFFPESDSRKRRNGVCVTPRGEAVFALSEAPVNFWEFSGLFKERFGCKNALFLDGTISSLYAPEIRRADGFFPLGPIVAVKKN